MTRVFVHTNILCYPHDKRDPVKQAQAEGIFIRLLAPQYAPVISTQVLQEFYNTLTRKLGFAPVDARRKLELLKGVDTVQITPAMVYSAVDLHGSASLQFWHALIVVSAQEALCEELWTEDFQPGQRFGNLVVVNPFRC